MTDYTVTTDSGDEVLCASFKEAKKCAEKFKHDNPIIDKSVDEELTLDSWHYKDGKLVRMVL